MEEESSCWYVYSFISSPFKRISYLVTCFSNLFPLRVISLLDLNVDTDNLTVQEALKLEASIVSYDWLEDSLQKRKKLAEAKYTWEAVKKKQRTDRAIKKMSKSYDSNSLALSHLLCALLTTI